MRIAVRREGAGERRVSIVPDSVKRLVAKKIDVSVESGAESLSFAADGEYRTGGARVESSLGALLSATDAVIQIRPPTVNELFFQPNTMMVLGDAKGTLLSMVSDLKEPQ